MVGAKTITVRETCGSTACTWQHSGGADGGFKPLQHYRNGERSSSWATRAVQAFRAIFLPEGYPSSVSDDYLDYQVYDSIQALCSSVTGTLSTKAILRGVGVGEVEATALSGLAQWVLRDGVGMVSRIGFATIISSDLDHDAKRWRLMADLCNDAGLLLEVTSAHFPKWMFLLFVCAANVFKSITCVAGGASRASLTQHFAIRQNTADVSAKDGSQETAVTLLGMFLGMFAAYAVPDAFSWTLGIFLAFTALHLWSNYRAVTSLVLNQLNETRLLIVLKHYVGPQRGRVPTPEEVRRLEPVVVPYRHAVRIVMGASLPASISNAQRDAKASNVAFAVAELQRSQFVVVPQRNGSQAVVLTSTADADPLLLLRAYLTALAQADSTYRHVDDAAFRSALEAAGWHLDRVQIRLRDYRVVLEPSGKVRVVDHDQ
jgi:hypothetical protein